MKEWIENKEERKPRDCLIVWRRIGKQGGEAERKGRRRRGRRMKRRVKIGKRRKKKEVKNRK